MSKRLMTVHLDPEEADLSRVRRKLDLAEDDIDANFGVVSIRPQDNLYAILVEDSVGSQLAGVEGVDGPYSNPIIEPAGLAGE